MNLSISAQIKGLALFRAKNQPISSQAFFETLFFIAQTQGNTLLAEKVSGRMGASPPDGNVQIYGFLSDTVSNGPHLDWIDTLVTFFVEHYFYLDKDVQYSLARWLSFLLNGEWRPKPSQPPRLFISQENMRQHMATFGVTGGQQDNNTARNIAYQIQMNFNQLFVIHSNFFAFELTSAEAANRLNSHAFKQLLCACTMSTSRTGVHTTDISLSEDILTFSLRLSLNAYEEPLMLSLVLGVARIFMQHPFFKSRIIVGEDWTALGYKRFTQHYVQYTEITNTLLHNFLLAHPTLHKKRTFVASAIKQKFTKKTHQGNLLLGTDSNTRYKKTADSALELLNYYISRLTCVGSPPSLSIGKCLIIYRHIEHLFHQSWMKPYILSSTKTSMQHILQAQAIKQQISLKDNHSKARVITQADHILNMAALYSYQLSLQDMLSLNAHRTALEKNPELTWDMSLLDIITLKSLSNDEQANSPPHVKVMMTQIGSLNITDVLTDAGIDNDAQRFLLEAFS